jgi:hypothetical protein
MITLCSKLCEVFQGETENDIFISFYELKLDGAPGTKQGKREGSKMERDFMSYICKLYFSIATENVKSYFSRRCY